MIHHLNCATFRPWFGGRFVAHCLLVERPGGLLLVDSGLGTADLEHSARLGRAWKGAMRPALDPQETAVEQIRALGLDPADVTDLVLTHLDLDHAGGIADFPRARTHVFEAELNAAQNPRGMEHGRYLREQWDDATWAAHPVGGDDWFGFGATHPVGGDDVVLIPLHGHSRGHAGVAVRGADGGWILHAGDAFFHHSEATATPSAPRRLRVLQKILAADDAQRVANQERLRDLVADHGSEVTVINAHDADLFDRFVPQG